MMRMDIIQGDPLTWLLEPDPANPALRYFALRDPVQLGSNSASHSVTGAMCWRTLR
jgi:hypothetical protein